MDDDADVVDGWTELLSEGHALRVFSASNGRDGVDRAREIQPDVVIMDLAMPEMDGLAATRLLKSDSATARIPIVAVTGSMYGSQRVLDAGCDGYMIKPIAPDALVEGIARVLRASPP